MKYEIKKLLYEINEVFECYYFSDDLKRVWAKIETHKKLIALLNQLETEMK